MISACAFLVAATACGDLESAPPGDEPDDARVALGAAAPAQALAVPTIAQALNCGAPSTAGLLTRAMELQRVDLDPALFPLARCNDGTPATFYFRPGSTAAGRERWVIQLQGGGGCRSGDSCAARWCSTDSNFGTTHMSSAQAPTDGIRADGILDNSAGLANPMATWNHVFVRYCTSDTWSGATGPMTVASHHPITGAAVSFQIEFNGRAVLDAVVKMLRRDGTAALNYRFVGGGTLPDLDTAKTVILAGASAGGGGVANSADYLGDLLRSKNPCQGAGCLEYRAIIDSTFGPDGLTLDWSTSDACLQHGLCTWKDLVTDGTAMFDRHGDQSCETWHAANDPQNLWQCDETDHVIRHHITTPMLLRMGLVDQLISGNSIDSGVSVPGRGPMTLALFTELVRAQLALHGSLTVAEERSAMTLPALYGPNCPKHETISANSSVYGVTIGVGGVRKTMFDIFTAWRAAGAPTQVVQAPGDLIDCN
ncbi:MAG TPA: pectin acetylesterase-family hydrolase [Kofleriaceae bacterium]|nr:pectin acetylesterase-family hydrolase [Kofleriaceae bacterium]